MKRFLHPSRRLLAAAAVSLALALAFAANAGRLLVIDRPQPADVIVVLAGETELRPVRALELLQQGFAPRILLNVPAGSTLYGISEIDLAHRYVAALPQAAAITICPIVGLSTRDESHDVKRCLPPGTHRVLLVTSDFHTRRALSIFRHELRDQDFSIAAAEDQTQFGKRWWTHRQWAKTCLDEWLRVFWWHTIDRWR